MRWSLLKPKGAALLALVAAGTTVGVLEWRRAGAGRSEQAGVVRDERAVRVEDADHPCGPVCVSVIAHLLGRPVPLDKCVQAVSPDALGNSSMQELVEGLEELRFRAAGVQLDRAAARRCGPFIAHVDESHFVVLLPAGHGNFVVVDPPHRPAVASFANLSMRWSGKAVLVARDDAELAEALGAMGLPLTPGAPRAALSEASP
jgi:hypothetical protein